MIYKSVIRICQRTVKRTFIAHFAMRSGLWFITQEYCPWPWKWKQFCIHITKNMTG